MSTYYRVSKGGKEIQRYYKDGCHYPDDVRGMGECAPGGRFKTLERAVRSCAEFLLSNPTPDSALVDLHEDGTVRVMINVFENNDAQVLEDPGQVERMLDRDENVWLADYEWYITKVTKSPITEEEVKALEGIARLE